MRLLIFLLALVIVVVLAGCGGGSGTETSVQPSVNAVKLPGTTPAGVTPTIAYRSAAQLRPILSGNAFVAGAQLGPNGQLFSQPITLTFQFAFPVTLSGGQELMVFTHNTDDNWLGRTDIPVSLSLAGLLVTVNIQEFPTDGQIVILKTGA